MPPVDDDRAGGPGHDDKADGAMLSIGEVANRVGIPTHILRYWESRFPELRPLQRSGGRRYYRVADVALVQRIHDLLHVQGFTVDGARKLIAGAGASGADKRQPMAQPAATSGSAVDVAALSALRARLAAALDR